MLLKRRKRRRRFDRVRQLSHQRERFDRVRQLRRRRDDDEEARSTDKVGSSSNNRSRSARGEETTERLERPPELTRLDLWWRSNQGQRHNEGDVIKDVDNGRGIDIELGGGKLGTENTTETGY